MQYFLTLLNDKCNTSIIPLLLLMSCLLFIGCAKKGIDPDAHDYKGRSLACIDEQMLMQAMYEQDPKLAAIDSVLGCQKMYHEDAPLYESANKEKHVRTGLDKYAESIGVAEKNILRGFTGLKSTANGYASNKADVEYESKFTQLSSAYNTYVSCLDRTLYSYPSLPNTKASLALYDTYASQIVQTCLPSISQDYLTPLASVYDSENVPNARASYVAERKSTIINHSMNYLKDKIKEVKLIRK